MRVCTWYLNLDQVFRMQARQMQCLSSSKNTYMNNLRQILSLIQIFSRTTGGVLKIMEYNSDFTQFWLGQIQSHDVLKPITHERKYMMDYSIVYGFVMASLFLEKRTNTLRIFGEQGWQSAESARVPPMCPGFDSRTQRHICQKMWRKQVTRHGNVLKAYMLYTTCCPFLVLSTLLVSK